MWGSAQTRYVCSLTAWKISEVFWKERIFFLFSKKKKWQKIKIVLRNAVFLRFNVMFALQIFEIQCIFALQTRHLHWQPTVSLLSHVIQHQPLREIVKQQPCRDLKDLKTKHSKMSSCPYPLPVQDPVPCVQYLLQECRLIHVRLLRTTLLLRTTRMRS